MPQHQHVARKLLAPKDTLALLSSSPETSTAVVFVHGFAGHAVKTWNQFHRLIDELALGETWWRNADLYFFGYDGVRSSTNTSADALLTFLGDVFPSPRDWYFSALETRPSVGNPGVRELRVRPGPYRYERLHLVAHSEGGVIVRLAMLSLARELSKSTQGDSIDLMKAMQKLSDEALAQGWMAERLSDEIRKATAASRPLGPPMLQAQLRLFAPAISGARVTGVLGFLEASYFGSVVRPFTNSLRAYHDLAAGSAVLNTLRDGTNQFAQQWPHLPALSASIVWAKKDDVVADQSFTRDTEFRVDDHSHTSVCKPNPDFLMPVKFVERGTV